jgi:tripartite-type tricarboxylate transporter receptor subunit TctC
MMGKLLLALALATCIASGAAVAAETFPSHGLTLVAGTSRGGITDVITRAYAEAVSNDLKQPVVVDNRPSESGGQAANYVQTAAPDGYTLLVFSGAQHVALPSIRAAGYDPVKSFAPVTTLFTLVNFLAVPSGSSVNSVEQLVALGTKKPGGLIFGSSGLGSTSHLTAARLAQSTNTQVKPVHYAGAAPMIADLVSGKLDFTFVSYTVAKPYAQDGRIKLLAVDAVERWPDLSQLPTLRQAGLNQEKVPSWFALAAPAGTPSPIIARLHHAFVKASRDPMLARVARENGALVATTSPQELQANIVRETQAASALVTALHLNRE